MAEVAGTIEIDRRTGRTSGAGPVERLGLAATIVAARALGPLKDFGFSYAAGGVARAFPSAKTIRLRFPDGAVFEFPYGDRYWSVLLRAGRTYEKGVESVLLGIADEPFAFIDCGANYGYWSVRVASPQFGAHPTVAIEAAPDTYAWLARNASANDHAFSAMNRAISARSGDVVSIYGAKHEARSIVDGGTPAVGRVETLALDDLLEHPEIGSTERIVLKLDVEGAETAALDGAKWLLERDLLIAYEDHGSDPSHAISAYLKQMLGMRLYAVEDGPIREVRELAELTTIKTNRRWGYDFFATRSPFWTQRMERLVDAQAIGAARKPPA